MNRDDPEVAQGLVRWLFLKALGVIYFSAFVSFGLQITGLIGANGILPVGDFLQAVQARFGPSSYWLVPTVFWLNTSDTFLQIVPLTGAILSLLLILGFTHRAILLLLFLLYLSLVSAGQEFMAFQWDILLLETGFLAIFAGSPSPIIIWLFRWLLFRLMFLSGAVKLLSGDPTWRNLTALDFHFETQPLPTVPGWFAHQLPGWVHQGSVIMMFGIELVVPFLFFAPRRPRFFAALATLLLQLLIFLTGNYGFFNLLAMALCLFLFDDASLRRVLPQRLFYARSQRLFYSRSHASRDAKRGNEHRKLSPGSQTEFGNQEKNQEKKAFTPQPESAFGRSIVIGLAVFIIFVSGFQLIGLFFGGVPQPVRVGLARVAPFHLVNTYGLFAVMTTARPEIIIEGSQDGQTWLAYEFKYKPGYVRRPPGWVAPHHPRLDWQLWFAALGDSTGQPWFLNLLLRLQQGSPEVVALLAKNPFPDAPPRYLRAWLYRYDFTDFAALRAEGVWWRRERAGLYFPLPATAP